MCQNHLSNKFEKWISTSYICATYFELTNPVVQNIHDKKVLGGILFYKHLLVTFKELDLSRILKLSTEGYLLYVFIPI